MLIVLEGVDGAGKTTLTDRLLKHLPYETTRRLRSGPLGQDPFREYEWRLKGYRPFSEENIIADRWHVGELVYGPLYRGHSRLTAAGARHVEMYLDKLGAHKVVVTASIDDITNRLKTRGDDFVKMEHVGLIWDFYNEYAHREGWSFVGSDEIVSYMINAARRKREEARRLWKFKTYVGGSHPKILFVGDQHGAPQYGRPNYDSAFVPYADTPGFFLLETLEERRIRDYGVANAVEEDTYDLWRALGRPHVIALGLSAYEALDKQVPVQVVDHPSDARYARTRRAYGHEIEAAIHASRS